jgi:hypothetical protein
VSNAKRANSPGLPNQPLRSVCYFESIGLSRGNSKVQITPFAILLLRMLVIIANYQDAISFAENARFAGPKIKKNFFDVFGTSGCILNCEEDRKVNRNFQYDKTQHVMRSRTERKGVRFAREKKIPGRLLS